MSPAGQYNGIGNDLARESATMPASDPVIIFYLALDEDPGDPVTHMALADWYEENDNLDAAESLRWIVDRRRWPFLYRKKGGGVRVEAEAWHDGWYWWAQDDISYGNDWGHGNWCRLPRLLWKNLPHTFNYNPAVFKEYETRRAAYEALFRAWPKYKNRRRKRK
jgi:hypothetical protein